MPTGFGSYCDEFGHPQDPNKHFTGIAGLLAWSDDWIEISSKWREVQKREDIPNPFHMVDFVHHKERFLNERWKSREERERILRLLLDIISDVKVIPVSAAVSNKDFSDLSLDQREKMESPYHVAFQEVTFNLAFAAANQALQTAKEMQEFWNNRIAMVYAKLRGFTGPAEKLWYAIKEHYVAAGNWMSSYTPTEPAAAPPLQIADIWAYSLGHMMENHPVTKKTPKNEARIAFNFFLRATHSSQGLGHKFYTFFDRNELLMRLGEPPEL